MESIWVIWKYFSLYLHQSTATIYLAAVLTNPMLNYGRIYALLQNKRGRWSRAAPPTVQLRTNDVT